MRAGLAHDQIQDATLREIQEVLDAAAWRRTQESRACISTAWHSAVFVGLAFSNKLKDLDEYLPGDPGEPAPEPVELEPEAEDHMWNLLLTPRGEAGASHGE